MAVYSVHKLMDETRRLAAEYHKATNKTLPVTAELAKFDAIRLLGLEALAEPQAGIDAIGDAWASGKKIQVKGRVIFDESKSGHRIGQLNVDANWEVLVLVLMDADYQTQEIYAIHRTDLSDVLDSGAKNKRGMISVGKFKAISALVWTFEDGLLTEEFNT